MAFSFFIQGSQSYSFEHLKTWSYWASVHHSKASIHVISSW